jgi:DNA polymerase-3 subunit epsilon
MRGGRIVDRFASLVDPQRSIPARTSAVHGLFDADVRGAPTLAQIVPRLAELVAAAVVVAHNARFDVAFLPCVRTRPVICTMRLAMHLVDTASYKNRDLFLALGLGDPALDGLPMHRALGDAMVTSRVLRALLEIYARSRRPQSVAELIREIALPVRTTSGPAGKAARWARPTKRAASVAAPTAEVG